MHACVPAPACGDAPLLARNKCDCTLGAADAGHALAWALYASETMPRPFVTAVLLQAGLPQIAAAGCIPAALQRRCQAGKFWHC